MSIVAHVAVLGAGIMGCATSLFLARRGVRVTLFDAAAAPFTGASRWNEGKIHLGYLYAADASLATARRMLAGGLAFKSLTEQLIGSSLDAVVSGHDETYAVHRASVTSVAATAHYFDAVSALVSGHPEAHGYLTPHASGPVHRLSAADLAHTFDPREIVAGFRVPERSVSTAWVADRFVAAVAAEGHIEPRMATTVIGVAEGPGAGTRWRVRTSAGDDGPFDAVVNALWQGRLAVDATAGLAPPVTWSHRYRLSAFVRTRRDVEVPSTVICTGPFGDVKSYTRRDFYLSWYLAGLRAESHAAAPLAPPALAAPERASVIEEILTRLGSIVPAVRTLANAVDEARLEGGWVYAAGQGSLADPTATLHRRDLIGIQNRGSYLSVDTGKYSVAPSLALQVADLLAPR